MDMVFMPGIGFDDIGGETSKEAVEEEEEPQSPKQKISARESFQKAFQRTVHLPPEPQLETPFSVIVRFYQLPEECQEIIPIEFIIRDPRMCKLSTFGHFMSKFSNELASSLLQPQNWSIGGGFQKPFYYAIHRLSKLCRVFEKVWRYNTPYRTIVTTHNYSVGTKKNQMTT